MAEYNAAQGLLNLSRKGSPNNGRVAYNVPQRISSQPKSNNGIDKIWNYKKESWFTPVTLNLTKKNGTKRKNRKNRKSRKNRK